MSSELGIKDMSKQWHGGKGDTPRVGNDEVYRSNWDRIFGGIDYGMLDKDVDMVGTQSDNLKKDSGTVEWRAYIILAKETMGYSVLEIFAIFTRIM